MKKFAAIFLAGALLFNLFACAAGDDVGNNDYKGDLGVVDDGVGSGSAADTDRVEGEAGSEGSGGAFAPGSGGAFAPDGAADAVGGPDGVLGGVTGEFESVSPGDKYEGSEDGSIKPAAGTLTAGEWKDLDDLAFWQELLRDNNWYALMEERTLFSDELAIVSVKDEQENPCFNATVELLDENETALYTAVTDITGRAYLPYDLLNEGKTPTAVRVGETKTPLAEGETTVTLSSGATAVTALDLMLTVDTTGSMRDELQYLQKELEDVIARIAEASDDVLSINVSVNFYRDTGDAYVVRPFEFTGDIDEAIKQLNDQNASGGGDYPEAVHTALESSIDEHQWRENAVKLLFLVLDAPPHSEKELAGINAQLTQTVTDAAEQGIRIIPVASSGVDTETEFLMRSYAVMTGGTYIFLTNHSGVGNDHLEPTIGEYQVEALNDCLVRVIKEYCGLQ